MTPSAPATGDADTPALHPEVLAIYHSEAFARLRQERGRLARRLTLAICAIYFGFILAIAFKPAWLATRLDDVITLGIPVGLGVIVAAILLTGVYVRVANARFDQLTADALRSARS